MLFHIDKICEIASDMTPASPNAFENQLQAVYAYNILRRPGSVSMDEWHGIDMEPTARQSAPGWRTSWAAVAYLGEGHGAMPLAKS